MAMAFPAAVKIGHLTYRIEPMSRVQAEQEGAYADIGIEDGVIRVQDDLPPALAAEKLLHEILHGCYDVWEIGGRWGEERTVTALAKGLATVLHDNPKLVAWLMRQLRESDSETQAA